MTSRPVDRVPANHKKGQEIVKHMRVLVNASNLRVGGGIQKAYQFIERMVHGETGTQWKFLVSPQVARNLHWPLEGPNYSTTVIEHSPARIVRGRNSRQGIRDIERNFRPDGVFTVYGPAYVRFQAPHIMGFAVPWVSTRDDLPWECYRPLWKRLRMYLWVKYVRWWVAYADEWIVETDTFAAEFAGEIGVDRELVHVVPNGGSRIYETAEPGATAPHPELGGRSPDEYRMLAFTSWKPHKNLEVLPQVALALKRKDPGFPAVFVLTLDRRKRAWQRLQHRVQELDVERYFRNLGPQPIELGPSLYGSCDAVFLPTLLEVFTATYPEAMSMERPLLTSDLPFARDICGPAARYFDPTDAESMAAAVLEVAKDSRLQESLRRAGRRRVEQIGDSDERFHRLMTVLRKSLSRGP